MITAYGDAETKRKALENGALLDENGIALDGALKTVAILLLWSLNTLSSGRPRRLIGQNSSVARRVRCASL